MLGIVLTVEQLLPPQEDISPMKLVTYRCIVIKLIAMRVGEICFPLAISIMYDIKEVSTSSC
jgi:hypothetical protein